MKFLLVLAFTGLVAAHPRRPEADDAPWSSYADCGKSDYPDAGTPFIINGKQARQGEFPWQVSLEGYSGGQFCGASIISPSWVLTAAHCTEWENIRSMSVVVGEHKFSDDNNAYRTRHYVSKIIEHEDYDTRDLDCDISLLKLTTPIEMNKFVQPICAPVGDNYGKRAQVSGWGNTRTSGWWPADTLTWTDVEVLKSCRGLDITSNMICAADHDKKRDSCQGDSGGPLTVNDGGVFRLVGIVSWGYDCAGYYPGVYTKTDQFVTWVNNKISENS